MLRGKASLGWLAVAVLTVSDQGFGDGSSAHQKSGRTALPNFNDGVLGVIRVDMPKINNK
jgi:hypothetical protein